jgi:hypothetical protein
VERSGRGLILRYYPRIFPEGVRKAMKNLSQDSRSAGKDFNPGPTEYEAGVLTADCDFRSFRSNNCPLIIVGQRLLSIKVSLSIFLSIKLWACISNLTFYAILRKNVVIAVSCLKQSTH